MTVWDTFFMMLMVIPVSKMISSIFMKLIARMGTIDEEKYAAMGMGTIMAIAAVAGMGKNKAGLLRRAGTAGLAGGSMLAGTSSGGYSGDGGSGGSGGISGEDPAAPSSATMDFLGVDSSPDTGAGATIGTGSGAVPGVGAGAFTESTYGAGVGDIGGGTGRATEAITPLGGSPLDDISQRAGDIANRAGTYGAYSGAVSPVAAPVVAAAMNLTTRVIAGPASAGYQVAQNMRSGFQGYREAGMGRADALSRSAMDLTGANSTSEASARILGSVLGSAFGGGGARAGANALGTTTRLVSDGSAWVRDKIM